MCCTYLQILFHVLQLLNVATTSSMNNIKLISEFIPNAPQHATVHHVDCSCYSIFHLCAWPARSPDLTVNDFFLYEYVKDKVYTLPLPVNIDNMKD